MADGERSRSGSGWQTIVAVIAALASVSSTAIAWKSLNAFGSNQRFSKMLDQCVASNSVQYRLVITEFAVRSDYAASGKISEKTEAELDQIFPQLFDITATLNLLFPQDDPLAKSSDALLSAVGKEIDAAEKHGLDAFEGTIDRTRETSVAFNKACDEKVKSYRGE